MASGSDNRPVLFAYDGSAPAKVAIEEAARQLGPHRDGIVLTVWEPLAALPFPSPVNGAADVEARMEHDAERVAREGARIARAAGFAATPLAEDGSPVWRSILDVADAHDAGLVVVGSHGRSGLSQVLLGSVASTVARHSDRPVFIVHAGA